MPQTGGSKNGYLCHQTSGGWSSKIKVLSGLVSSEASLRRRRLMMAFSSQCPHMVFPLCLSVSLSLFILVLGLPQWPPLTLMTYLKTLSPKVVTFWGTRDWDFSSSTHNSGIKKTDISQPRPKHDSPCSGSNSFLWIKGTLMRHSPRACYVTSTNSVRAHKQKGSTLSGPFCRWGNWGMECSSDLPRLPGCCALRHQCSALP